MWPDEEDREHDIANGRVDLRCESDLVVRVGWLLAQKPWIVPIPGTTKLHRLEENIASAQVELSPGEVGELSEAASKIEVKGARLPEAVLKFSNR